MKARDRKLALRINKVLSKFDRTFKILEGIAKDAERESFVLQVIDSFHRIHFISLIKQRNLAPSRLDPSSPYFDPLKAAILHQAAGHLDEACWLVFLSVHFGKNLRTGWRLVQDVYGGLGAPSPWSWNRISRNPKQFRLWLSKKEAQLQGGDGVSRHFGNHRKYQSLSASKPNGTAAAIETYINWVGPQKSHSVRFDEALDATGHDARKTFDVLYHSLDAVISFGRMAKFDYLTMIGKISLAPIEPPSTYMQGATGPLVGSRLLFTGNARTKLPRAQIETWLGTLDRMLQLPFGMQILEDAICNWQKSPSTFKRFRG